VYGYWTASITPEGDHQNVYVVIDDLGRVWPEADAESMDIEMVISDLLQCPPRGRFQHRRGLVAR
jgi:hypothetical protein